jgi:hypothetical protein
MSGIWFVQCHSDTIMEQSVRELGHLLGASEVTLYSSPEVSRLIRARQHRVRVSKEQHGKKRRN